MNLQERLMKIEQEIPFIKGKLARENGEPQRYGEGYCRFRCVTDAQLLGTCDYFVAVAKWCVYETYGAGTSFEYGVGEVQLYRDVLLNGWLQVFWVRKPQYNLEPVLHEWKSPVVHIQRRKKSEPLECSSEISAQVLDRNTIEVGWKRCRDPFLNYLLDLDDHEHPNYIE